MARVHHDVLHLGKGSGEVYWQEGNEALLESWLAARGLDPLRAATLSWEMRDLALELLLRAGATRVGE